MNDALHRLKDDSIELDAEMDMFSYNSENWTDEQRLQSKEEVENRINSFEDELRKLVDEMVKDKKEKFSKLQ